MLFPTDWNSNIALSSDATSASVHASATPPQYLKPGFWGAHNYVDVIYISLLHM